MKKMYISPEIKIQELKSQMLASSQQSLGNCGCEGSNCHCTDRSQCTGNGHNGKEDCNMKPIKMASPFYEEY